MLLRRAFSIYNVAARGVYGGTVEIVFAVHGKGTRGSPSATAHDTVDIVGPLGKPFALPREPVACVLVGGGYGAAPLFTLADAAARARLPRRLRARRRDRGPAVRRAGRQAHRGHADAHDRGRVGRAARPGHRRAAGGARAHRRRRRLRLRADGDAHARSRPSRRPTAPHAQCAVEESMACGIGVCMTCVLPVVGDDGVTRMVRSCVEGPVFRGDRVRWDDVGTVPADAVGAPCGGAALMTRAVITHQPDRGLARRRDPTVDMSAVARRHRSCPTRS